MNTDSLSKRTKLKDSLIESLQTWYPEVILSTIGGMAIWFVNQHKSLSYVLHPAFIAALLSVMLSFAIGIRQYYSEGGPQPLKRALWGAIFFALVMFYAWYQQLYLFSAIDIYTIIALVFGFIGILFSATLYLKGLTAADNWWFFVRLVGAMILASVFTNVMVIVFSISWYSFKVLIYELPEDNYRFITVFILSATYPLFLGNFIPTLSTLKEKQTYPAVIKKAGYNLYAFSMVMYGLVCYSWVFNWFTKEGSMGEQIYVPTISFAAAAFIGRFLLSPTELKNDAHGKHDTLKRAAVYVSVILFLSVSLYQALFVDAEGISQEKLTLLYILVPAIIVAAYILVFGHIRYQYSLGILSVWAIITAITPLNPFKLTAKSAEEMVKDITDRRLIVNNKIDLPFAKNNTFDENNSYDALEELNNGHDHNRHRFAEALSDRTRHKFDSLTATGKRTRNILSIGLLGYDLYDADGIVSIGDTAYQPSSETMYFETETYDIKAFGNAYGFSMVKYNPNESNEVPQVSDLGAELEIKYAVDRSVKVPKTLLMNEQGKLKQESFHRFEHEGLKCGLILQQVVVEYKTKKPAKPEDISFIEFKGVLLCP